MSDAGSVGPKAPANIKKSEKSTRPLPSMSAVSVGGRRGWNDHARRRRGDPQFLSVRVVGVQDDLTGEGIFTQFGCITHLSGFAGRYTCLACSCYAGRGIVDGNREVDVTVVSNRYAIRASSLDI